MVESVVCPDAVLQGDTVTATVRIRSGILARLTKLSSVTKSRLTKLREEKTERRASGQGTSKVTLNVPMICENPITTLGGEGYSTGHPHHSTGMHAETNYNPLFCHDRREP